MCCLPRAKAVLLRRHTCGCLLSQRCSAPWCTLSVPKKMLALLSSGRATRPTESRFLCKMSGSWILKMTADLQIIALKILQSRDHLKQQSLCYNYTINVLILGDDRWTVATFFFFFFYNLFVLTGAASSWNKILKAYRCIPSTNPSQTYLVFLFTENQLSSKETLTRKHCKELITVCFATSGEKILPILI